MANYYPAALTARSKTLYETLRAWAEPRGDVTIIGGWAVVALVAAEAIVPSRDVDLVFRTKQALADFQQQAPIWTLEPSLDQQDNRIVYAYKQDPTGTTVVDIFTTDDWGRAFFPKNTNVLTKELPFAGLLPPVAWLVKEKLSTIPNRTGTGALDKQEKDILDLHRLVFHNRDAIPPLELLADAPRALRREALARLPRCIDNHPEFAADFRKIGEWLRH